MASITAAPPMQCVTVPTVRTCYDLMCVAPACGVTDFTDGKYEGDTASPGHDRTAYLAAQKRQADYLLDQARCGAGTRLLDIGCGYGRILEQAARRGTQAVGITISPPQVADCRARGLAVYERNYRELLENPLPAPSHEVREAPFDAVIANGSLEHFVQAADAAAGRANEIYCEMFSICRQLLTTGGRLVTTAIHFRCAQQFDAAEMLNGPGAHRARSPEHHYAMLVKCFGGWYPEPGQLERCAAGKFALVEEEDGTHDYHLTSEYWLRQFARKIAHDPRVWWAVTRQVWQHPRGALRFLRLHLWDQSWAWQFRPPAPMQLLRQTWEAV